jgi:hypothetical protein
VRYALTNIVSKRGWETVGWQGVLQDRHLDLHRPFFLQLLVPVGSPVVRRGRSKFADRVSRTRVSRIVFQKIQFSSFGYVGSASLALLPDSVWLRIPTIATTDSDGSRPPVPIDRDQCGSGAGGTVG